MKALPLTKANEILAATNQLSQAGGAFVGTDTLEWRKLKREAEKIVHADPSVGWSVYAAVMTLAGDIEETNRALRAALPFAIADPSIIEDYMVSKIALGFFSDALELGKERSSPEYGRFTQRCSELIVAGGFRTVAAHLLRAAEIGLDVRGLDVGHVPIAARLMAEAGLDDEDVAKHLDLAGEVLRNRRLKWSGHPCLCVHGVDGLFKAVTYVLSVRQSRDEVFEMNCELADAEVRANVKRHPYFDITFIAA
ncbi:hypothetical protein [Cupriavidus plantarum]|uniref:Uncharacterized protein n=1 Tax=Cupriavidus plantarum TaxID=942865 RepID=A0A316F580_9BURK|nr:hypothetical protein [Cupriavidus plantarum]PWK38988.1 hypothetical protein C7419_1012891 [Cupriavidus plantarum]